MKKRVHISECTDADILAEDLTNSQGVLLLSCGTIVNDYIIGKLAELGIEYLLIADKMENKECSFADYHFFEKKYDNCVDVIKHLILELAKGKKIDYEVLNEVTDLVVSAGQEPEYIIKCLGKIRCADEYTYYHSVNTSLYTMMIASQLNLGREDIRNVIWAGLLHDLGKAKISNDLLNKQEKLTVADYEEIKRHVIYGYELIKDEDQIPDMIKEVILMHHEREDKSGYPFRISGDDLSIFTKIVAVADVFDAMTSNRVYKKALTPFDAFEEFSAVCIGRLDIHIINSLLSSLLKYYTGSRVLLSNGQYGNIAYIPPHCMWKPVIDTGLSFLDLSTVKEVTIIGVV